MKIAFWLYPTDKIKIDEDSSFWILYEMARRGHQAFFFESRHLFCQNGSPRAYLTPARLKLPQGFLPSAPEKSATDLASLDCLFIRKEPPFDAEYLQTLQLLRLLEKKVLLINDPAGIALCGEKTFPLNFPELIPETLVTQDPETACRFIVKLRSKVVVKPLDNRAGLGILALQPRDRSLRSILELATQEGKRHVLIQRFVSADTYGDKRLLLLNGEILGCFARKPSREDFRANLSRGGSMHASAPTRRDLAIVETLRKPLKDHGLWLTGIDVIGPYLTEVNVTSPSGIPEIRHFTKKRVERTIADFIESSLDRKRSGASRTALDGSPRHARASRSYPRDSF